MSDVSPTYAFVLDGQGNPASVSPQTIATARHDARTPLGAAVLLSCYQALVQDLSSLSPTERAESGITVDACPDPDALLDLPRRAPHNAIVGNVHLYLIQILRYIANIDGRPNRSVHPTFGVLGFSTGFVAASVIACADSLPQLVVHATEAFRLAFWIGLRAQQHAHRALRDVPTSAPEESWTLVTFGATRAEVQGAVDRYNAEQGTAVQVYLTAMTNDKCASVSSRPDALNAFGREYLPPSIIQSRLANIHTLYHSPELESIKTQVMHDIASRAVKFPSYGSLRHTLRSPVDGEPIREAAGSTLAEQVVDATLLSPVNFDQVVSSIATSLSASDAGITFVNLGPGNVLWRSTARALPNVRLTMLDWSSAPPALAPTPTPLPAQPAVPDAAPAREPIAIIGMAVKFPGAPDADGLWRVLEQGLNTVSEIPASRFDVSAYNQGAARSLKTTLGNFIDDPDVFDNAFFHVSPREARSMDPQQRLLLHVAYHALEDAGYVPGATLSFDQETFATYIGAATNDYVQNLRNAVDVYYSTGTLQAFLSGKLSYAFKFSGPSLVVDTACSSSMVAIHQACRALSNGDCNAALAGGVNVITSPDMYLGLDRAHFLSPTGNCKPWDASADGYARSEGCGVFVLKRLSDAVRENDRVLGVIRAVEVNQSARADSITQPHVPTQVALFKKLLASAGVEPSRVGVVEAHGTGTKAGDPAETQSIRTVFAQHRTAGTPLLLTSVKASIGHAEAASGAASLAKLLLMLRHRTVPAVVSLKTLNPRIPPLAADGTCIPTAPRAWAAPPRGARRLALLNNFGAAGSNAALLLEEAEAAPRAAPAAPAVVLGLSCDSEAALEAQRAAYVRRVEEAGGDGVGLGDVAYTATARRQTYRYRLAAAGRTTEELVAGLRRAQVVQVDGRAGKTVFVFSGQGGQYLGMGRGLYGSVPSFKRTVDRCHEKLVGWGYPGVLDVICPREGQAEEDFRLFQAAVFVLECALAGMWTSWGVKPDAVVGHSLGEYAALVTAGVLTLEDGLKIVAGRAHLMAEKCTLDDTGMLAVKMSPVELAAHLMQSTKYDQLSVACHNSCEDGVVAGKLAQLDVLQAELKASGRKCAKVNVPFGYHTRAMQPILDDLTILASHAQFDPPKITVVSNVHGKVVSPGDASVFTAEYFARHCVEPVKFEQGIQDLLAHDLSTVSAWVEIGPHPTSLPMLRSMPATSNQAMYLPTLKKNTDDWHIVCGSLASLYCSDISVDWRKVFADLGPDARVVDLPAYPFAKTRFWVKYEESIPPTAPAAPLPPVSTRFSLLEVVKNMPSPGSTDPACFETPIAKLAHLIEGHQVAGYALCPASVYIEMASAAAQLVFEHQGRIDGDGTVALSEITFSNPLVYSPDVARTVCVEVALAGPGDKHGGSFVVSSYTSDPATAQPHCAGKLALASKTVTRAKFGMSATTVERRHRAIAESRHAETFYTRTVYDLIFSRIVAYGSAYRTMKSISVDPNGVDACAVVQFPEKSIPGTFVAHPVFMDTLLHAVGFVVNCNADQNEAFICSQVDKVKVIPELVKADARYGVYCNVGFLSDSIAIGDAYAFELGTSPVNVVAVMKRMRFKKLRLSGFKAVLAAAASPSGPTRSAKVPGLSAKSQTGVGADPAVHAPTPLPLVHRVSGSMAEQIKGIMAHALGISPLDIGDRQDLERLGLDSLTSIEARHTLCSALGVVLPENVFATCRTISDIVSAVGGHVTPRAASPSPVPSSPGESESTLNDGANLDLARAANLVRVRGILASVLGLADKDLRDDLELERIGMDSLMSIEAHHALSTALDADLPHDLFSTCKTVRDVQDLVAPPSVLAKQLGDAVPSSVVASSFGTEDNPVLLQDGRESMKPPLFLIHDGSGVAHQYGRLSPLGRCVWGIHNPKFPEGGKWDGGLPEMAEHYTDLVKKTLGTASRCILGGWSIGGVIAFEVARRLIASGVDVAGLVLIDCPDPDTTTPLSKEILDAAFARSTPSRAVELARSSIEHATAALVQYDPWSSPVKHASLKKAVMLRCREPFSIERGDAKARSNSFLAHRRDPRTITGGWETVLGFQVPVLDVPGNHFEPFSPRYVGEVSKRLLEALDRLA